MFFKQLESAIYEFHEKYSVELGSFYNPRSSEQQERFYKLVADKMGPELAKNGIEVTGAQFKM